MSECVNSRSCSWNSGACSNWEIGDVVAPVEAAERLARRAEEALPYRIRCITALADGKVIGLGGLGFRPDGTVICFAQINDPSLFVSKLALTCDPLVRLSRVPDSILKLTVAVRKLLDYDVAAAGCPAVYDVRCQRDSLTFTKFVVCHAGQSYEYLVEAMRQFADGERTNSTDMTNLMKAIPAAEREAMARYISARPPTRRG